MGWGLIMTWVLLYYTTEFQYNTRSPFPRVPGNVASARTSPSGPPEGLFGPPDIIPPLWFLFIKLVLRITSPPLNRFPRFQLRWISFESTFPTTYYTSMYVQGILRKSMQTKELATPISRSPEQI